MKIVKKELLILTHKKYLSNEIVKYLNKYYNCTFIDNLFFSKYTKDDIDLVLFGGGSDVNPSLYGQEKHYSTHFDYKRDLHEISLFNSVDKNVPKLGICRGSQLLTVLSGANLIQDVTGHNASHNIKTKDNKIMLATSTHHQMMNPYFLKPENYTIYGTVDVKKSIHYIVNKNQNYKTPSNFVEPEIVYYNKTNSLCIQGHPERDYYTKTYSNYCKTLIEKLLNNEL